MLNNKNIFQNKYNNEYILNLLDIFVSGALLFITPIILQHQLIVGVIVNALLIRCALKHSNKKLLIIALVPNLGALAGGILLGANTQFLALMIPFIWAGNFAIAIVSKKLFLQKKINYFLAVGSGAILKTIILFGSAFALLQFALVPVAFLTVFGINQLLTAIGGAIIAYISIFGFKTKL